MNPQSKHVSEACRDELEKRMPSGPVIRFLVSNGILTNTQKEKLLKCKNNYDANKMLLDELLVCDPYPFDVLRSALRAVGQYRILNILDSDQYADPNESDSIAEPEAIFGKMRHDETIQEFIQRVIRPDKSFQETCTKAFQIAKQRIQDHFKAYESKIDIFQGGSCGKDTHVQDHSDVDIIVQLEWEDTVEELSKRIHENVCMIIKALTEGNDEECTIAVGKGNKNKSVPKLKLRFNRALEKWIDIDLVTIANILKSRESRDIRQHLAKIYLEMKSADKDILSLYSKCLSKLLINFVKKSPENVKDVIRLLKYWNDIDELGITPTCIELVVISTWEQSTSMSLYNLLCRSVKEFTVYSTLSIAWNVYYTPAAYTVNIMGPYILDPTNPFNNLHLGNEWDPGQFNIKRIE